MASSFALKENSVVNSCTSSGRCLPVHKPIPTVFAAAHKGKQIENDMDNAVNKENCKSHVLVDLTKLKVNEEVNITTPVSEGRVGAAGLLTPVVEDKGIRLYKSSALGSYGNLLGNKSTTGLSSVAPELSHSTEGDSTRPSKDTKESWESDAAVHIAKSSLPTVCHAIINEQIAADNHLDRMTIWIWNVERVVEDAQANFAAGSMTPLLPLPPQTAQANRQASAKVTEIFQDKNAARDNSLNDTPPLELAKSETHTPLQNPTWLSAVLDPTLSLHPQSR
ncbi:hypothetical protein BU17DRAFT_70068 [Hysterangium stoloniferum]|nr:hypothetical protein BU17DRAFT_70068 [Hysterangium stoloniferum]